MSNKILTACSNGNFMIFDTEKNRFGKQWSAVSLVRDQELIFLQSVKYLRDTREPCCAC